MDGLMKIRRSAICENYVIGDHIFLSIADIFPVTEFIIKKKDADNYYCEAIKEKSWN